MPASNVKYIEEI